MSLAQDVLNIGLAELKVNLLNVMGDVVKDLWSAENTAFLTQLVEDVANEAWQCLTDKDHADIHHQNLQHLAATLEGDTLIKELQIDADKAQIFADLLSAVIKAVTAVFSSEIQKII
jgi:hypothetical protein